MSESPEDPQQPHVPRPVTPGTQASFGTYGGRPVSFVRRGTLARLALDAEDLGRRWGTGEPVTGRGIDLLMAACGRAAVLDRLTGPGVAQLAGRLRR